MEQKICLPMIFLWSISYILVDLIITLASRKNLEFSMSFLTLLPFQHFVLIKRNCFCACYKAALAMLIMSFAFNLFLHFFRTNLIIAAKR
jgi:hypothetical protein